MSASWVFAGGTPDGPDWAERSALLDEHIRRRLIDTAAGEDALLAAELVTTARDRLRYDPVLRSRAETVARVLEIDARTGYGGRRGADTTRNADQLTAALALVVAEKVPLPSASRSGAAETLARTLWARLGLPATNRSWLQLLADGKTGVQSAYRAIGTELLTALEAAGYRLVSGVQEVAE